MRRPLFLLQVGILGLTSFCAASDNGWMKHVSGTERNRTNPFAKRADAVAGGARLFSDHCAKCHGEDALGRGKRPSLRSEEVQQATDGEIFWLLKNGYLSKGMPSWSALPEASRWQLISYVKSLGQQDNGASAPEPQGNRK
jgi:mono/diheme cytochrome c family protein